MRILGLDSGEETGYAIIDAANGQMSVHTYGVIPITHPGLGGLLKDVWFWLRQYEECVIVFEEFIISPKLRTTKEAAEVRGVIRLFCSIYGTLQESESYAPATIRSALECKNKAEIRKMIQDDILGYKVRGKDHVTDAMAVALCHAVKLGLWDIPRTKKDRDFSLTRQLGGHQAKSPQTLEAVESMSAAELGEALKAGKIKVGRRC